MPPDRFLTTQWTVVLSARGDHTQARQALSVLCQNYYAPIVSFLQRESRSQDAAQETAHGFFEWLLTQDRFGALDPTQARFRSYLLGALKHYLSHEREHARRLKRGGEAEHRSLEDIGEPIANLTLPPDQEFDRQWALHVISAALDHLERSWAHPIPFTALRPHITAEATHGNLATLAESHTIKESTLRSLLHRLRKAMRRQIRDQIAETLPTRALLDDEMQALFAALREG